MGRASERTADRGGHHIRQQAEGLVALRQGARMAGVRRAPGQSRTPAAPSAPANGCVPGENDLASLFPKFCRSVAQGEERRPASRAGNAELKPQSLVALLAGSRVAGRGGCAHVERQRMSLLRGEEGADRLQRPRDPQTAAGKTVHPKLNGSLTPEMVTPGSHRKVWWQCPDGHVWRPSSTPAPALKKAAAPSARGGTASGGWKNGTVNA